MIGVILIAIVISGYFLVLNSKVKSKGAILLEKAITAVLSTFLFSLYLALSGHTPVEEQQAGVGYTSFEGLFIIASLFSLPLFLICGGLFSFFVDIYLDKIYFRKTFLRYISGFFVYLAGGLLIVGAFFVILLSIPGEAGGLLISDIIRISAIPALLFYHISLVTKKVLRIGVGKER